MRLRPDEERALCAWSEQAGLMLDSSGFDRHWREQGEKGDAEHRLYFDQAAQRWFKSNNLSNYENWMAYFQAIQLHNWLFPRAPLGFEGLAKGNTLATHILPEPSAEDLGESWVAWLMARISLAEAAELVQPGSSINGNSSPPQP
jgi:hypothetical protein